jgi:hypothetical protein
MKRLAYLAAITTAMTVALASTACAGTYTVPACADASGAVNNSWTVSNSSPEKLETGNVCGTPGSGAALYSRDVLDVSNANADANAQWTFDAPSGTSITGISYSRWLYKEGDDDWQPAVRADGTTIESCSIVYPGIDCKVGLQDGERTNASLGGVNSVSVGVVCGATAPLTCSNGAAGSHDAIAMLYGATVTLTDSSAPTVSSLAGPLLADGYKKGSTFASFDASDNVGIRSARLYVDGAAQPAVTYTCDFTYTVPCSNKTGAELTLDTRALSDGTHTVQVAASDAAGNEQKSSARSITVDNGAPASPVGIGIDGGGDWHASNSFAVSWTNPTGQVAPIAAAHYAVCAADGTSCQPEQQVPGQDIARVDGISVPGPGTWQLQLWLGDAAGNADAAQHSTVLLRYGSAPLTEVPDSASPTATDLSVPIAEPNSPDSVAAPIATIPSFSTPTLLRPALVLTSARFSHRRLVIRGRTARGAAGRITVRIRSGTRVVRVRGGTFRIALRLRLKPRSVSVSYAGSALFAPQTRRAPVR